MISRLISTRGLWVHWRGWGRINSEEGSSRTVPRGRMLIRVSVLWISNKNSGVKALVGWSKSVCSLSLLSDCWTYGKLVRQWMQHIHREQLQKIYIYINRNTEKQKARLGRYNEAECRIYNMLLLSLSNFVNDCKHYLQSICLRYCKLYVTGLYFDGLRFLRITALT